MDDNEASLLGSSRAPSVSFDYTVRRLTPTERERLMGWPDGWTQWGLNEDGTRIDLADTVRDRLTGNGVVTPIARWIANRIAATED